MNNQMFFYPLYPYDELIDEREGNVNLFTPLETLEKGNLFKNEYIGYKNYKPRKLNQNNELIKLMAIKNYCHDLMLYLDIYPDDEALKNLYKEEYDKYISMKKIYESKNNDFFKYL